MVRLECRVLLGFLDRQESREILGYKDKPELEFKEIQVFRESLGFMVKPVFKAERAFRGRLAFKGIRERVSKEILESKV
jgi:hypothetical protein